LGKRLITKLLAIHLAVIAFAMGVVWLSIDTLAAGYFVTLMEKYHISPEPAHEMFVSAVHRYLIWSSLAAAALAVILSFLMMRKALGPLTRMRDTTRDIAAGDFSARVPVTSRDEVGELAGAFNRMAESLEKIEHLRRNLMIDVTHELRTPLTNIRGYLEALADGVVPPTDETFALLNEETGRLAGLVEDVLDLAKADAARGGLTLESVDLYEALDTVLSSFERAFHRKSLRVRITPSDRQVLLQADRKRLTRVLRNLVDNAVRYTQPGSDIEIVIRPGGGNVVVDVLNPAGTLTPDDLPYLFERFYRGEKSRSREHGGAGIGLAIVRELVEAHGGSVDADLLDGRARFRVTLPVDPSEPLP
jgi:signal transduction histidine kinase